MTTNSAVLVWFRRDLRAHDHAALHAALRASTQVYCVFVFDTDILDALPTRDDRRVEFLWQSVCALAETLATMAGGRGPVLHVLHGSARSCIPALAQSLGVKAVYANHDYEPDALARDHAVAQALATQGLPLNTRKDQVIFDGDEVLTKMGQPFSVFTPYKNAWLQRLDAFYVKPYPITPYASHLALVPSPSDLPSLASLGFTQTNLSSLGVAGGSGAARVLLDDFLTRIDAYDQRRDYPAVKGPSYLSVHLRFGTLSIRELVTLAKQRDSSGAAVWLSELIWRDFYFMILARHPRVVHASFRPEYDAIEWAQAPELQQAWCEARTGYPIVDAAMRQLHQTGYMHNRLRMIVASFLTKDLGIDWRVGERHFAQHLIDFDLAANNGGWQWAASTGCDAQPYFRIFNPVTQSERFDPKGQFIRRYVPELAGVSDRHIHAPWLLSPIEAQAAGVRLGETYPAPVVDHANARLTTLARYGKVKKPA